MKAEWLREPMNAGDSHIYVELGEAAKITPEVKAAIESLAKALQAAEHSPRKEKPCPNLMVCNPRDLCAPETVVPCALLITCRIG